MHASPERWATGRWGAGFRDGAVGGGGVRRISARDAKNRVSSVEAVSVPQRAGDARGSFAYD